MPVRFGFGIFTGQVPLGGSAAREYRALLELAPVAERAGFDSLWVSEHHCAGDGYLPALLPLLAAVAARTTTIRLGTGVMLAPFHHPLRLAEDAAAVDLLSGGRLILGLGAGWRDEEFRSFGVTGRGAHVEDMLHILPKAWSGRRFSHRGRHHSFDDVLVLPGPERPIPLWIGAGAAPALRRAGRLADGFLSTLAEPAVVRERLDIADAAARDAGREPPAVGVLLDAWIGPPVAGLAEGLWQARQVYTVWREGRDRPGAEYRLPEMDAPGLPAIAGEPEELRGALARYVEAVGPERDLTLLVRLYYPGMEVEPVVAAVERFGREVIERMAAPTSVA